MAMGKPVIFVIGASGNVGGATVRQLSLQHGEHFKLKAGTRNPDKAEKLKALENVDVVKAKMGGEGLEEVFQGVDALFIVTPPVEDCAEPVGKTVEAAKAAGVNFVLVVSAATVPEVDTIYGSQMRDVEEKVRAIGVQFCFLRLHALFENMLFSADTVKKDSYFDDPVDGDKSYALVSVSDIGKAAAAILTCWSKHTGKTYVLGSDSTSYNDIAKQMSSLLGKEVKYVQKPYDESRKQWLSTGWPEWICDGLLQFYKLVDSGSSSVTAYDKAVLESITGEKPTTYHEFLKENINAFQ